MADWIEQPHVYLVIRDEEGLEITYDRARLRMDVHEYEVVITVTEFDRRTLDHHG